MRFLLLVLLCSLPLTACRDTPPEEYVFDVQRALDDPDAERERMQRAAEAGNAEARFRIAFTQLMKRDYDEALPTFEQLADEEHVGSIRMLSFMYREGKGVDVDFERAAYWTRRAADLGDPLAIQEIAAYEAYTADAGE